ncbi:MAG TPA: helix-turn-helix domain-containing protein [Sediminibacterium sp.]|nr:helix-turn-helix domain-containing protein [Sediminibacterium sp.]
MTFDSSFFSHRLKLKQSVMKLSVRETAKQIGISPATVSRLNNGATPDIETFAMCCKWMRLEMERFFKHK